MFNLSAVDASMLISAVLVLIPAIAVVLHIREGGGPGA